MPGIRARLNEEETFKGNKVAVVQDERVLVPYSLAMTVHTSELCAVLSEGLLSVLPRKKTGTKSTRGDGIGDWLVVISQCIHM